MVFSKPNLSPDPSLVFSPVFSFGPRSSPGPVGVPGWQGSTQGSAAVGPDVSVAVGVEVLLPSLGGPGSFDLDRDIRTRVTEDSGGTDRTSEVLSPVYSRPRWWFGWS